MLAVVNARSADVGLRVASVQGARVESAAGRRLVRLIGSLVRPSLESNQAMLGGVEVPGAVPAVRGGSGDSAGGRGR